MKTNDDSTEKSALALGAVAFVSALIANILAGFALRRGGGRSKSTEAARPTPRRRSDAAYDAHRVIVAPTAYAEPAPVSSPAPVSYNAGPASSPAVAALRWLRDGEENAQSGPAKSRPLDVDRTRSRTLSRDTNHQL